MQAVPNIMSQRADCNLCTGPGSLTARLAVNVLPVLAPPQASAAGCLAYDRHQRSC